MGEPQCGKIDEVPLPLVVNGKEATYGRFPWQAALYIFHANDWTFWCGGSLVSHSLILTGKLLCFPLYIFLTGLQNLFNFNVFHSGTLCLAD